MALFMSGQMTERSTPSRPTAKGPPKACGLCAVKTPNTLVVHPKNNPVNTAFTVLLILCLQLPLEAADKTSAPKTVLVHYMPWYASKPVSGNWGWHWTMDRFKPDKVVANGRRELASHYRPLIGPYDSNDPDVLECQVLLMKFAGISGVIIDWYGTENFNDYATIHRNSLSLIKYIKQAGLKFAICYEDQSVKHMVQGGKLKKADEVAHGKKVLKWLDQNWFADPAYVKVKGKPILLIFGPQHFKKAQWTQMMTGLSKRPHLYALPHLAQNAGANGAFGWPPVDGGKNVTPAVWQTYLGNLYSRGAKGESIIALVFPKFHDIYKEAGTQASYGYLDGQGGKTFEQTLELAWKSNSALIQIATWNDYGEGTMIEPTKEFAYRYLESIQRRFAANGKFAYTPIDLRLPIMLHQLRKHYAGNRGLTAKLNHASKLLFASRTGEAKTLLMQLWNQKQ